MAAAKRIPPHELYRSVKSEIQHINTTCALPYNPMRCLHVQAAIVPVDIHHQCSYTHKY